MLPVQKLITTASFAALVLAMPYTVNISASDTGVVGMRMAVRANNACASGGFCTEAGCTSGPDYCYQPPGGGMCYSTAPIKDN